MITIKDLQNAGKVLNIVALCTAAGLKPVTIRAKINRSTELSVTESEALEAELLKLGFTFKRPQKKD